MLRIVLLGRTGNNLFQYALGRVLAERHQVPLVLDASWFNAAGWAEVSFFLKLPIKARVVRRCSLGARALRNLTGMHYWEYLDGPVLKESATDQSFSRHFLNAPADCMLFGYFQSPRYFEEIADELRAELNSLIGGRPVSESHMISMLGEPGSVAVHVRRKDYVDLPQFRVCGSTYYKSAMREMRDRVPGARFFVFSDDPDWCRSMFTEADTRVVDSGEEGVNPLHDLHLMSLASHHIIANSTYSWWAAWLGEKAGQQVIMPDRWYAHGIKAPVEEKNPGHWSVIATGT